MTFSIDRIMKTRLPRGEEERFEDPESDSGREARQRVGESLRMAREKAGLSFDEISQILKIPSRALQALEEGDHKALSGPSYALGFLRNYANHLGLDAESLVMRTQKSLKSPPHRPHFARAPKDVSHTPSRRALLLACLLLLLVSVFYRTIYAPPKTAPLASPPQSLLP